MLPPGDRSISRQHCKLKYKYGFPVRYIPESWIAVLMAHHSRLGADSALRYIPFEVIQYILLFLKQPMKMWLSDPSSTCGTYVRVSSDEPMEIRSHLQFLIGDDITIEIHEVVNTPQKLEICDVDTSSDATQQEIPKVRLTIYQAPEHEDGTFHTHSFTFVAQANFSCHTIGRAQNNEVVLHDSTISRRQCRIFFHNSKWYILDGGDSGPSSNGTWLSLVELERGRNKPKRIKYEVKNNTQIKISETLLMVNLSF